MDEVYEKKAKIEENFWHQQYDYILKRCIDLGVDTLKKYVKPDQMRKLSRREQTN